MRGTADLVELTPIFIFIRNYTLFMSIYLEYNARSQNGPEGSLYNPRANGAKRRSGRKPGARVTNSALAFTYIRIMRSYIAQWHSGIKSDQKSSSILDLDVGRSFNVMRMRESRPRKSWKLAAS